MKKIFLILLALCFNLMLHGWALAGENKEEEKPLKYKTIAIDPGHGGYDPGAIWKDVYEKDINFKVSKILAQNLEAQGAKVILTRHGDYNYALVGMHGRQAKRYDMQQRIKLIEENNADIVLTIHVNSSHKNTYEGAETFYFHKSAKGKLLALSIQQELREIPGMTKRIAKVSGCYMIRYTKIPGVLVELGYLSNVHERRLLLDPQYHNILAQKITKGVINYYKSPATTKDTSLALDAATAADCVMRAMSKAIFGREDEF